jgi:glucuronosyltransferase
LPPAHRKVRLFITHGGLLSGQEAMYNGVPVIGIPVFGDQKMNVIRSVNEGYGIMLNLKNITKDTVLAAIEKGLNDERYDVNKIYARLGLKIRIWIQNKR